MKIPLQILIVIFSFIKIANSQISQNRSKSFEPLRGAQPGFGPKQPEAKEKLHVPDFSKLKSEVRATLEQKFKDEVSMITKVFFL